MSTKASFLFLIMLLGLLASGCRAKREAIEAGEELPRRYTREAFVLNQLEEQRPDFNWLTVRAKARFVGIGESVSSTVNLKVQKDSVIWASISPLLGIELARVKLTPDSLYLLDRMKKRYAILPFSAISRFTGVRGLTFQMLQDLLLGNAVLPLEKGFEVNEEEELITLYKETDRFNEQVWVNPEIFRITRFYYNSRQEPQTLDINYGSYTQLAEEWLPQLLDFSLLMPEEVKVNMEYQRLSFSDHEVAAFTVPDGYERITF